jgi:hypothetical protein
MPDLFRYLGIESRGFLQESERVPDRQGLSAKEEIVYDRHKIFCFQRQPFHLLFSDSKVAAQHL